MHAGNAFQFSYRDLTSGYEALLQTVGVAAMLAPPNFRLFSTWHEYTSAQIGLLSKAAELHPDLLS